MSVTFDVSDVALGTELPFGPTTVPNALQELTCNGYLDFTPQPDGAVSLKPVHDPMPGLESWSDVDGDLLSVGMHPFVGAVSVAFQQHFPLVLTPDHVWIVLAQGFARHVRLHAEELRERFVRHKGREVISIRRDDFRKGDKANPWPEVFEAFSHSLREHIGPRHDLVVADFSTTGPLERAVSQLVLMDAMEKYFDYRMATVCGIPRITLEGTPDDWRSIRRRVQMFDEFGLEDWTKALLPLLDEFVAAAEGNVNKAFWQSIYKLNDASGGPYVTGWVQALFPYLVVGKSPTVTQNPHFREWRAGMNQEFGGGPMPDDFAGSINSVPFTWNYLAESIPMEFMAGFVGIVQDASTRALTPQLGWAVRRTEGESSA